MFPFDPAQLKTFTPNRILNIIKVMASYHFSILTGKVRLWGYPSVLSVEPSSICNLKCPQCPTGIGTLERPQGEMDFELFKAVIDDTAKYLTNLQLFFQGEPFLNKNLFDMIQYAGKKNIYTLTSTNGHFLNEDNIGKLLDSRLNAIVIGLDGVTPEVYMNYRKNGAFDKVIEGIRLLISKRSELGLNRPKVYIQFIVMKQNETQVEQVRSLGAELKVDETLIKTAQVYPGTNPDDFIPENPEFSRYKKEDGNLVLNYDIPDKCKRIWTTAVMTWDGRLAACCFDKDADNSFGSWTGGPFLNIWRSKKGIDFRRQILKNRKQIPICSNCTEGLKEFL